MEILVVLVIIGTLAAIALPAFIGQKNTAHDADAKSQVGALASYMETCFVEEESYLPCTREAGRKSKPPRGKGVRVRGRHSYEVFATSQSGSTFALRRTSSGMQRSCSPAAKGGCLANGSW